MVALLFTTLGCAHTQRVTHADAVNLLESFEPSGSFCIDAYILNSAAQGCAEWSARTIQELGELRCLQPGESESFWVTSTFVFFSSSSPPPEIPRFELLCADNQVFFGRINVQ